MVIFVKNMKPTRNQHIMRFLALMLAGLFVHLSGHAQSHSSRLQNQNLNYWAQQDQATRMIFSRMSTTFNYVFQSRVVCDSSFNSVSGCHIINKTQNTGTTTNMYGDFKISANINDTISFSVLGYEKLTIVVTESMYNYGYIVKLKPIAYELEELTITPFSIDFPSISRFEIYTPPLPNQGGINLLPTEINPVSFFYNKFSKEGKQKRYYKKVIDGTADFMVIGEKYNGLMVSQITGLKDDELIKFMSYCNFSKDFLLNYSPETIRRAIRQKYSEFAEL